jgi:hypothetical protein
VFFVSPFAKNQGSELVFAHDPAEFPERKEGNEYAKYHDGAASELIKPDVL